MVAATTTPLPAAAPLTGGVRRAWRRAAAIRVFDVLGRPTEGVLPIASGELRLHRVTSIDGLLRDAPSPLSWPVIERMAQRPALARLRARRQVRSRAARFGAGDVAYVAAAGGRVAAWVWVSRRARMHCRYSGLRFRLQPGEAYLYDLWTVPDYRANNAGVFVMRGAIHDLNERGDASQVYGYVQRDNRPSQVLHRLLLGFQQVQEVKGLRLLSLWARQLPFTERPRFGPCTRATHSAPVGKDRP